MTFNNLDYPALQSPQWWPVAVANTLNKTPILARKLLGTSVVIFKNQSGQLGALPDRCPHRFAPLSQGKIQGDYLQCPYHGWEFNPAGICSKIAGQLREQESTNMPQKAWLSPLPICENNGLIWVYIGRHLNNDLFHNIELLSISETVSENPIMDTFFLSDSLNCYLVDALENFLDPFHTHFIHSKWIRHTNQRQQVKVSIEPSENNGVQARYSEEGKQSGIISALLERNRGESWGRFTLPCLAELEYRDKSNRLSLLIRVWFVPEDAENLRFYACIQTPQGKVPAFIKQRILKTLFSVILKQDKTILEKTHLNQMAFRQQEIFAPEIRPFYHYHDLLRPSIEALLNNTLCEIKSQQKTIFI